METFRPSFPFSMEKIPRQRRFACLTFKIGSIISALLSFLESGLVLVPSSVECWSLASQSSVDNANYAPHFPHEWMAIVIAILIWYSVTLFLTFVMLVGVLTEICHLIRPWLVWARLQLVVHLIITVRWTVRNFTNLSDGKTSLIFVVFLLILLFRFFLLLPVVGYYEKLNKNKQQVNDGGEQVKSKVHQDNTV